jgi:hypothetical protein
MSQDHELEAALARVLTQSADTTAAERIVAKLASAPLPAQKRRLAWWPAVLADRDFAPAWPRLAALAGAAALGISIGLSGLGARIATDLDLVRVAATEDIPTNVFDVDAGLRP